ncbi:MULTISPECIES: MOSC N-terminal beta barrel domain-containing protein [unclassified Modicisalibacter]|uniref:MOSC domain-containing protein n=1 Tax=unclassified Modicisalibacter TaxID=2679913 RepID=UPI001CCCED86|nr:MULTISPECIES: MOSC N-terminal beta barrel domain-containing protein [unclassified Modicisalibacter]MBZ9559849.1 MOSC domain-containing protein [Modicisalibacter sp. R2A 31.J]MBZ9577301.1 MOSC domain-containing protein [Modicisalibacter sp. MOD 31.J]
MSDTQTLARLSEIYRYPVKSTAARSLTRALVSEEGLDGDRRYMLARPDGRFVTARTHPALQRVIVEPVDGGLDLHHPEAGAIEARETRFARESFTTAVWGDTFVAVTTETALDAWFSEILGEPVRLLWLGATSPRYRESLQRRVSFADGYPLMLISQASLEALNARMDAPQRMIQFRPNLVVAGTAAHAEDAWARIRIGEVEFRVDTPCARCKMITVDPTTGTFQARGEPLRTLAGYRRGADGKILFGQNLIALNTGELIVGAPVEVLETRATSI